MRQSLGTTVGAVINDLTPGGQSSQPSQAFANISQSSFSSYGTLPSNRKLNDTSSSTLSQTNEGQELNTQTDEVS